MEKYLYTPKNNTESYKLWMAYPACEAFAMASLGYLWLSKIAEEDSNIYAEKVFTDSKTTILNIKEVGAIAFSVSFDFDFIGVFEILEKNNIPLLSQDRDDNYPLIFAGGPVITTNPEPYSNIYDFMIIGDGEDVFIKVLEILSKKESKTETLKKLANISGVYVPKINTKVKKVTADLNNVIYTPIISKKSYFKDTFIIEISRGCMNRCAFCTASYTNLPFRYYDYDKIIEIIDLGLKYTNKIALLGAQLSAHPEFISIMKYLENKIDNGENLEIGISSLRTDSVTPEIIKILTKGGQKTSTIAIEAASERLRKIINKNLNEEQIINAVRISRENGLKGIKIYSMIGIPTENQTDIDEFIRLAKTLKTENKGFDITFSFSSFVPKPQTPFQWEKREETKTLEQKQKYIEKEMAKLGISTKFSSIKWDYWQTILSRGDSSLTEFLVSVYKKGGKIGAYKSSAKDLKLNLEKFINKQDYEIDLPWDFIENYPPKQLLINENKRLHKFL